MSAFLKRRAYLNLAVCFQFTASVLAIFCVTEQPAKAYTDPGSGAVLYQLLFASIVSIGFHFRKMRVWLQNRRTRR
jgi:hypothetical protein